MKPVVPTSGQIALHGRTATVTVTVRDITAKSAAPRTPKRIAAAPRAPRQPRSINGGAGDSLPLDVLPPAIGRDGAESAEVDEEPKRPRRRTRASRPADDEGEIAPAA